MHSKAFEKQKNNLPFLNFFFLKRFIILTKNQYRKKTLLQKSNTEEGTLRSLVARKILRIEEIEIGRLDFSHDQKR
jgi:hypothetical protein